MKTLTFSERNAGLFEKKVRLGDQMHLAVVDAHGITARLENGEYFYLVLSRSIFGIEGWKLEFRSADFHSLHSIGVLEVVIPKREKGVNDHEKKKVQID